MKNADVLLKILVVILDRVFHNTGLMTESDSSEKLSDHQLVDVVGSWEDQIGCLVMILGGEFELVG